MCRPCCFEITVQDDKVIFYGKSSVEYTTWIQLMRLAVEMARRNVGKRATKADVQANGRNDGIFSDNGIMSDDGINR